MIQNAEILRRVAEDVAEGRIAPYLGPEVLTLTPGGSPVPASPAALCAFIEAKIAVPRRAKGNLWSVAQFVEQRRFRASVVAMMVEAFAATPRDNPVHQWLAQIRPPLIVDSWYDDSMQASLARTSGPGGSGASDWGLIQAVSQAEEWIGTWTKTFSPSGESLDESAASSWRTVLYKPHGAIRPHKSFLLTDADYVEALTEIDIQTPIPDEVKLRRTDRGFLFLGCRFDDQTLRIYARQIMKRSGGPHYAVLSGGLTRMEQRFLAEQGIIRIDAPLESAIELLSRTVVPA
jgi:hypothetical protein